MQVKTRRAFGDNYLIAPLCSLQFYLAPETRCLSPVQRPSEGQQGFFFLPKLFHLVTLLCCDWLAHILLESILAEFLLEVRWQGIKSDKVL